MRTLFLAFCAKAFLITAHFSPYIVGTGMVAGNASNLEVTLGEPAQNSLDIDPNLALCIKKSLPAGTNFTAENLQMIFELDCSYSNISSLKGLAYLTGLKVLNLSHNNISDATEIYSINLAKLDLSYNELMDIPTCGDKKLGINGIDLSHNRIGSIHYVKNLFEFYDDELELLDLSYNNITDVSPLQGLKMWVEPGLKLNQNCITDFSPISDFSDFIGKTDQKKCCITE